MNYGYARIGGKKESIAVQTTALQNYGVTEIYEEHSNIRKEVNGNIMELLRRMTAGDTLVVWKFSILGRTVRQLLFVAMELDARGIYFVSLTEEFDTSTPYGKYCITILRYLNQMECELKDTPMVEVKSEAASAHSRGRKPHDPKKVELAIKMYNSNEFAAKEIAEITGISRASLYKYINEIKESK